MNKQDLQKAQELSKRLHSLSPYAKQVSVRPKKKYKPDIIDKILASRTKAPVKEVIKKEWMGEPGKDGRNGKDGLDGARGKDGRDGRDGRDGKNADEIDATKLADKLNSLDEAVDFKVLKNIPQGFDPKDFKIGGKHQLELRDIKGARLDMSDQKWHGGGDTVAAGTNITITRSNGVATINSTGGSGSGFLSATGTVDGVNQTFTFTSAPSVVFRDGVAMQKTSSDGSPNWTGTTSIILSIAPNFDIFALG